MTAAIYYASNGFRVEQNKVMGRQVAGNSFLNAYLKYSNDDEFWIHSISKEEADDFVEFARSHGRKEPIKVIDLNNIGALREPGMLFYPGPDISTQARNRSFYKDNLWSICGITHTTSSAKIMDSIQSLITAPVTSKDAIICTSQAVKSNLIKIIETEEENLRQNFKASNFSRPQLPVIPLGIHTPEFDFTDEQKNIARKGFGIKNDEIVILYVGRLSFHAKANPFQMYKSIDLVAQESKKKVVLIECGWFANQGIKDSFVQASNYLCNGVKVIRVDGRIQDIKLKSFAAADIFCSLSDNVQETFGITPIEAMAAGLPVIVSDWDGYKDSIADGVEGFLIPSIMPEAGYGLDLAYRYASNIDNYDMYLGNISNFISVEFNALSKAFYKLINNKQLRLDMGMNGKRKSAQEFDWSKIIRNYQELWRELKYKRLTSNDVNYQWSARLDPFLAFSSYSTNKISDQSKFKLVEKNVDLSIKTFNKIKELDIVNYSKYTQPNSHIVFKIINNIGKNNKSLSQLKNDLKDINQIYLVRSLFWLTKFNLLEIYVD